MGKKTRGKLGIPGGWKNRFARIYSGIRDRCTNPNNPGRNIYGGKGVKCLWPTIDNFITDMYESYLKHVEKFGEKETTIDRIDSNGNYCKKNCRRATRKEQNNNKNNLLYVTIDGIKYSAAEYSEKFNISRELATQRFRLYNQGKLSYKALCTPGLANQGEAAIIIDGQSLTIREFAEKYHIGRTTAKRRIDRYLRGEISYEYLIYNGRGNPWVFNLREKNEKK